MSHDHTIVLTSYKRPDNLSRVLEGVFSQTFPHSRLVLVDNSPRHYRPRLRDLRHFDEVIRFNDNAGPCCRFLGAMFNDTEYTIFLDDDIAIGDKFVEACYHTSDVLEGKFSTISGIGRTTVRTRKKSPFRGKNKMLKKNIQRLPEQRSIDVTCRGHFFRSTDIGSALKYYQMAKSDGMGESVLRNDDIFLSLGIQLDTGYKSYMTGTMDSGRRTKMNQSELNSPFSCSSNDDHRSSRDRLVAWFNGLGWKPLRYKE